MKLRPPLEPMLAKPVAAIPEGMAYEPKWDGFRCLVFRDKDDVVLGSRGGKDLAPYFPELVATLLENTPPRCVLDGEIVIVDGEHLNFDLLTQRIHPAASRVERLSAEHPASFVAWDVLALDGDVLLERPFAERRALLERALGNAEAPVHVSPQTRDRAIAERWFLQFEGAGLDGVMAKPLDGVYTPGRRTVFKIKHQREADVVVAGWTLHKGSTGDAPQVGGLQLGLYDDQDRLHWVGTTSAFTAKVRAEMAEHLGALTVPGGVEHPWAGEQTANGPRLPGQMSRWTKQTKELVLIDPLLVATVAYDHMEGARFRHNPRFLRWRPDREPLSCTFDQLEVPVTYRLSEVLAEG